MRQQQRQPPVALVLRTVLLVALARPARAVVLSCEATTGDGLYEGLDWLKENCPSKPAS